MTEGLVVIQPVMELINTFIVLGEISQPRQLVLVWQGQPYRLIIRVTQYVGMEKCLVRRHVMIIFMEDAILLVLA